MELLIHPVRIRILHALFDGATCTTSELCERLADVSKATVYRQVSLLAEAGVLEVAGEHRVRGAVERHYRLCRSQARIDGEAAAAMTLEDHRQAFAAAVAALVAEFSAYLDRPGASPTADSVGYRQIPIWLSRDELEHLVRSTTDLIAGQLGNEPHGDRRRYLLSPILFPIE